MDSLLGLLEGARSLGAQWDAMLMAAVGVPWASSWAPCRACP